jgi:hypothetical protein
MNEYIYCNAIPPSKLKIPYYLARRVYFLKEPWSIHQIRWMHQLIRYSDGWMERKNNKYRQVSSSLANRWMD